MDTSGTVPVNAYVVLKTGEDAQKLLEINGKVQFLAFVSLHVAVVQR